MKVTTKIKFWEFVGYFSLVMVVLGQITIGFDFWIGQTAYFLANVATVVRCFAVGQPTADKVKNVVITAIGIGVSIVKIITA